MTHSNPNTIKIHNILLPLGTIQGQSGVEPAIAVAPLTHGRDKAIVPQVNQGRKQHPETAAVGTRATESINVALHLRAIAVLRHSGNTNVDGHISRQHVHDHHALARREVLIDAACHKGSELRESATKKQGVHS